MVIILDYKEISEQLKNEKKLTEEEGRKLDEERYNKLLQKQLQEYKDFVENHSLILQLLEYRNFIEKYGLILDKQNKFFNITTHLKSQANYQYFLLLCSDWGLKYTDNKQIIPFTDFGWKIFKAYIKFKEEMI